MFTGLVQELGVVERLNRVDSGGIQLELRHSAELSQRLEIGASLAVAGTCLTVIEMSPGRTLVEMSPETLARTTLDRLAAGDSVNLEPALRMGDPLGGHWVQGHVDTTTRVTRRRDLGAAEAELAGHRVLGFALPPGLEASFVEKGSVTVDGVSLTVSDLDDEEFRVALIPHTLECTTLDGLMPGDPVNIEVDVLAKYVQRALAAQLQKVAEKGSE